MHHLKNPATVSHKAALELSEDAVILGLTGTPIQNDPLVSHYCALLIVLLLLLLLLVLHAMFAITTTAAGAALASSNAGAALASSSDALEQ
jgi:hypothetical protein